MKVVASVVEVCLTTPSVRNRRHEMISTHVDSTFFTQNTPMKKHPNSANISWETVLKINNRLLHRPEIPILKLLSTLFTLDVWISNALKCFKICIGLESCLFSILLLLSLVSTMICLQQTRRRNRPIYINCHPAPYNLTPLRVKEITIC